MAIETIPGSDVQRYKGSDGKTYETEEPLAGATADTASYSRSVAPVPVSPDQQFTIAQIQTVQTLTVPAGATVALIQNNTTAAIRWRDNGSVPTTTLGIRLLAGTEPLVYDGSLAALRLIAEGSGTGTLDISYYR